jgi:hypothetical protein
MKKERKKKLKKSFIFSFYLNLEENENPNKRKRERKYMIEKNSNFFFLTQKKVKNLEFTNTHFFHRKNLNLS